MSATVANAAAAFVVSEACAGPMQQALRGCEMWSPLSVGLQSKNTRETLVKTEQGIQGSMERNTGFERNHFPCTLGHLTVPGLSEGW